MKKLLFIAVLSFFAFANVNAQEKETEEVPVQETQKVESTESETATSFYENDEGEIIETSKPIFQFEKESHDFGELPEGDKHAYEFAFTNVGAEPLIIQGVKASCGCTTPIWPKEPIMPGESATIKAVYNTKGRIGKFNKAVTITSNAITPTKRLYIKGDVLKTEVEPVAPVKKAGSIVNEQEGND